MRLLLKVSRPRFWFYLFGPYIVGLAAGVTDRAHLLDWRYLLLGLYFLLPANLLVYGVNDIFDYETDRLNPKKAEYEALVAPDSRRRLFYWIMGLNLPFIVLAAGLFDARTFAALQTFIFLSIFYSSPPLRAKTKPFLDSAFNILYVIAATFPLLFQSRVSVHDGLVSIRRSFRDDELRAAFHAAGMPRVAVRRVFPYRLLAIAPVEEPAEGA